MTTLQKMRIGERQRRKRLIVEAAACLVEEKRIRDVSLADIARQLGISKASIYTYFPRLDDVLMEVLLRQKRELERLFENRMGKRSAALEDLVLVGADYLLKHRSFFQLLILMVTGQLTPGNPERCRSAEADFRDMLEKVKDCVTRGFAEPFPSPAISAYVLGSVLAFENCPGCTQEEIRVLIKKITEPADGLFPPNQRDPMGPAACS